MLVAIRKHWWVQMVDVLNNDSKVIWMMEVRNESLLMICQYNIEKVQHCQTHLNVRNYYNNQFFLSHHIKADGKLNIFAIGSIGKESH